MLNVLSTNEDDGAPLILVYGPAGMGKTTLGLSAPNCLYLPINPEAPPRGIQCDRLEAVQDFPTMMDNLRALFKEQHKYEVLVVDSLDALEPCVIRETCRKNGWVDIETPSYGKGWQANDETWRIFIHAIDMIRRRRGITVIWCALAESSNHEDPGMPPYKKYSLRLQKRGEKLVTQAADAVLFLNTKTSLKEIDTGFNQKVHVADGGGTRWVFCDARPAFIAKNRFGMPDAIMLDKKNPWSSIAKFVAFKKPEHTKVEPELPFNVQQPPLSIPADKPNPHQQETYEETVGGDSIPI